MPEESRIYEILIRGRSDGTIDPSAAHVMFWEPDGVDRDGTPRWSVGAPRQSTVAAVGPIIGAHEADLIEAAATALAEAAKARANLDAANAARDGAISDLVASRSELADLKDRVAGLSADLAESTARASDAMASCDALRRERDALAQKISEFGMISTTTQKTQEDVAI